jgi:hypothetical protein
MANDKKILLLTEGETDIQIAKAILEAAKFPISQIQFEVADGWQNAFKIAKNRTQDFDKVIVLVDTDAPTVPDAKLHWQNRLLNNDVEVLFAIPEIESWIFADEALLRKQLNGHASKTLDRLPLPEEIPHPKQLVGNILRTLKDRNFLKDMDVQTAAARTPSLRDFLLKIGEYLDVDTTHLKGSVSVSMSRKVIAGLLKEVSASDKIMYKALDGNQYTAKEVWEQVEEGTEFGKQYALELLRVARDYIQWQATH